MTSSPLVAALDHPRLVPALIVAASVGALGTALFAQYVGDLQPCVLCVYQRYAYGVALAAGLIGGVIPGVRRPAIAVAALAFLGGAGVAFFHVGVEQLWWRGTTQCQAPGFDPNASIAELRKQLLQTRPVACDQVPWSLFGISIAGYNMLASLAFAAASLWAVMRMGRDTSR